MNKNRGLLILFLSLVLLWFISPSLVINVPFTNKEVVLKSKNPKLNLFGKEINLSKELKYGLDLQGGSSLTFGLDTSNVSRENQKQAVESAREVVEKRVNFFGTTEPSILLLENAGKYKIMVDMPGKKDPQEAIDQIGRVAQLEFREYGVQEMKQGTQSAMVPYFSKTSLTGKFLKKASLVFDSQTGKPQISLLFNKEGRVLFAELTKKNIKKPLAIFLDEQLLTAPVVQQEIKDGKAVITGGFTIEEAKKLINALNAGAIPLPVKLLEQKTVEATLGQENIQKSIYAGIVGLVCVAIFMILLYRREGFVAVLSLCLYAIYSLAAFKFLGVVLTMSGVAGFILSIGMAVDSNILIYERIREEKKLLSNDKLAVKVGFLKALGAIKDANINTLLICLVLFNPLNSSLLPLFGAVRGFAVTLALGVVLSLLTGVFVTKNILWSLYKIDIKND